MCSPIWSTPRRRGWRWRRGGWRRRICGSGAVTGRAAHWLAAVTGKTVGEAVRLLDTAEVAEKAPATMQALKDGECRSAKANAVGQGRSVRSRARARSSSTGGRTRNVSVKEIEQDSARIVHAASGDTEPSRRRGSEGPGVTDRVQR